MTAPADRAALEKRLRALSSQREAFEAADLIETDGPLRERIEALEAGLREFVDLSHEDPGGEGYCSGCDDGRSDPIPFPCKYERARALLPPPDTTPQGDDDG